MTKRSMRRILKREDGSPAERLSEEEGAEGSFGTGKQKRQAGSFLCWNLEVLESEDGKSIRTAMKVSFHDLSPLPDRSLV